MKKKIKKKITVIAASVLFLIAGSGTLWYWLQSTKLAIIQILEHSAQSRELSYQKAYLDQKIPLPIATLAATVERLENDISSLNNELLRATPEECAQIKGAIELADQAILTLIKQSKDLLNKYGEKARRTHNGNLFKIVTILQSCSFLFERSM